MSKDPILQAASPATDTLPGFVQAAFKTGKGACIGLRDSFESIPGPWQMMVITLCILAAFSTLTLVILASGFSSQPSNLPDIYAGLEDGKSLDNDTCPFHYNPPKPTSIIRIVLDNLPPNEESNKTDPLTPALPLPLPLPSPTFEPLAPDFVRISMSDIKTAFNSPSKVVSWVVIGTFAYSASHYGGVFLA